MPEMSSGRFAALAILLLAGCAQPGWRAQVGDARSGFLPLERNEAALLWRLVLIDSATRSLDLQYYLWYADFSGRLLLEAVIRAADRGVQVRILVDDLLTVGEDEDIAALDAHPNVQVRLFNPWYERSRGMLGRAVEFLARTGHSPRAMRGSAFRTR